MSLRLLAAALLATAVLHASSAAATNYDACVIGAGGSGAYAAMRLKQLGRSVLLLEKQGRVGGHCETFYTPSGDHVDPGVELYVNYTIVRKTFADFNVSLTPWSQNPRLAPATITFGPYGNYRGFEIPPNAQEIPQFAAVFQGFVDAANTWAKVFEERFSFIETPNGANIDFYALDSATRNMLFKPFGPFLDKLAKESGSRTIFDPLHAVFQNVLLNGYGPWREVPVYTALRMLRPGTVLFFTGAGYTATRGCSSIYDAFAAYLGDAVQLNVTQLAVERRHGTNPRRVRLTYTDSAGAAQAAACRVLVVAAEQHLSNLKSFITDLDHREEGVFSQVTSSTLTQTLFSLPPADVPGTYPFLDVWIRGVNGSYLPGSTGMYKYPFGYGNTWSFYDTPPMAIDPEAARELDFNNVVHFANVSGAFAPPVSIGDFDTDLHTYNLRPRTARDMPHFFRSLYALQGHRDTYYTGALLSFNLQSDVWRYSEDLVTNIIKW